MVKHQARSGDNAIRTELTASNFYSAVVNSVEPSSKLNSMYYKTFLSSANRHCKKYEAYVRDLYIVLLRGNGIDPRVIEVGLQLSTSFPFLGTSLDGIVFYKGQVWGLKIKCPSSKLNMSLQDAVLDKKFFLVDDSGNIKLQHKNPYYFQVQGQIFRANIEGVDLVVWLGNGEPFFAETIHFDKKFMMDYIFPRLK